MDGAGLDGSVRIEANYEGGLILRVAVSVDFFDYDIMSIHTV